MSFVGTLRRFKQEKVQSLPTRIIREVVEEFGGSLVAEWSPIGQPETWKSPPPADYKPGNFRSSWFLSIGAPSTETTTATDQREIHHLERLTDFRAGETICLSNSAPHAGAIEGGHSMQAPTGILVNAMEFEGMALTIARRLA